MPTDNDLRRKIAELEGWIDVHEFPGGPLVGIEPTRRVSRSVPDWTTDANAAMELVEKIAIPNCVVSASLQMRPDNNRWFVWLAPPGTPSMIFGRDGSSFCEAVCRLYIAWREAKDATAAIANAEQTTGVVIQWGPATGGSAAAEYGRRIKGTPNEPR